MLPITNESIGLFILITSCLTINHITSILSTKWISLPVTNFLWACPNAYWSCWNKFHNFFLQKEMWSSRAGLVNEKKRLDFCRRHTSSLLNRMMNEAMGIEDHRGGGRPLFDY
jgi:hypothetical protein